MATREKTGPDFIEALARGLDVIRAFRRSAPEMSLTEVASATDLPRPTARRILLTLQDMGYVRSADGLFSLTARVLELGMAYMDAQDLWAVARPHMERLVGQTGESSSMGQLNGSDMIYVARVAVPKIITLAVNVGTMFPALQTSLGKVLLADLDQQELDRVLKMPSRSGVQPLWNPERGEALAALAEVRKRGWALTDQELALGIRSIAVPVRDGTGRVAAALNVTVHAAGTPVNVLTEIYLPLLQQSADAIERDWKLRGAVPHINLQRAATELSPGRT
jgi:IclR family pca regulon transcriptional regulator